MAAAAKPHPLFASQPLPLASLRLSRREAQPTSLPLLSRVLSAFSALFFRTLHWRRRGRRRLALPSLVALLYVSTTLCLCYLSLGSANATDTAPENSPLFVSDGHVRELLNATDFYQHVRDSLKVEVVMLYAGWCPHCHDYAPTFKRIAENWREAEATDFNAVDCAHNAETGQVCREQNISGFPTIEVFVDRVAFERSASQRRRGKSTIGAVKEGNDSHEQKEDQMDQKMEGEASQKGDGKTEVEEEFDAKLTSSKTQYYWKVPFDQRSEEKFVLWMQEHVLLDAFHKRLVGGSPSDAPPVTSPSEVNQTANKPSEEVVDSTVAAPLPLFGRADGDLRRGPRLRRNSSVDDRPARWPKTAETMNPHWKLRDASYALLYLLRNWIFLGKMMLSSKEQMALLRFLELTRYVFPAKEFKFSLYRAAMFITEKSRQGGTGNGDGKAEDGLLTFAEWSQFLDSFKVGPFGPLNLGVLPKFVQCSSLLCGIWTLLHFLTVGAEHLLDITVWKFGELNTFFLGPNGLTSPWIYDKYVSLYHELKGEAVRAVAQSQGKIYLKDQADKFEEGVDSSVASSPLSPGAVDPVVFLPFYSSNVPSASHPNIAVITQTLLGEMTHQLGGVVFSAYEVMGIIRSVIEHFFGCQFCHDHFIWSFDRCSFDRCKLVHMPESFRKTVMWPPSLSLAPRAYPLLDKQKENENFDGLRIWLWRLHNGVTVRTATEGIAELRNIQRVRQVSGEGQETFVDNEGETMLSQVQSVGGTNATGSPHTWGQLWNKTLVDYEGVDPRWPTKQSCPLCRDTQVSAMPFVLLAEFIEQHMNGLLGDGNYDAYRDYDVQRISRCLDSHYWLKEWDLIENIEFDPAKIVFINTSKVHTFLSRAMERFAYMLPRMPQGELASRYATLFLGMMVVMMACWWVLSMQRKQKCVAIRQWFRLKRNRYCRPKTLGDAFVDALHPQNNAVHKNDRNGTLLCNLLGGWSNERAIGEELKEGAPFTEDEDEGCPSVVNSGYRMSPGVSNRISSHLLKL